MSSNGEEQATVDESGHVLPDLLSNDQPLTADADVCMSNSAKTARELNLRRSVTNGGCVRKGYRAFCFGLYFGVSLATLLSLAVLYVELYKVKAELGAVQHQLSLYRRQHGSRPRDPTDWQEVTAETEETILSDDASPPAVEEYSRRKNYKIKRDNRQRQTSSPGVVRGSGVTQEQVREMIRNSLPSHVHPSAHLAYYHPMHQSNNTFSEEHVFYWTEHHRSGLTHNNLFTHRDDNSRLVIRTSGTFFLYVQVMYNGRRTSNHPSCSHLVKLKPRESPNTSRLLMHSSTTQYNLGRPIAVHYDGSFARAFDSSFAAGVFRLEAGDELRVEMDELDGSKSCRIIPHADRTYFGAFRLHTASDLPSFPLSP